MGSASAAWELMPVRTKSLLSAVYGGLTGRIRIFLTECPDDRAMFDLLTAWVPTTAMRNQILVHNPAEVYGFAD
jgi:hypothetical protein